MEYQKIFKQKVLPRYLKAITSVVSLADIAICACEHDLGDGEKASLRAELELAQTQMQEAATEVKKIRDGVDSDSQDTTLKDLQDEVHEQRKNLQQVEKDLVSQEIEKEKIKDRVQEIRTNILHTEDILNTMNAQKAGKKTLRNMGIGLIIIPFIGIPMALGATKEIKRCEELIKNTSESKGVLEKDCKQKEETLECGNEKIKELKVKRVEGVESLREKEVELAVLKGEVDLLLSVGEKISDNVSYITKLEGLLKMLNRQCSEETFYGIAGVRGILDKIFTCIQEEGCEDWLHDFNIDRKLSELEGKITTFNRISKP
ncbi:uncharacterized protein LOC119978250 [Scyliorhinus canicula]|uniref:uncharacterized protein LOC119978250 n=1 Tax=Scyliorhinus canicula TaxID=7830 RepID=UPI0018F367EF|nr:uncharacterized protein LOC119978250 [Scyliorhinus canicula]